MGEKRDNKYFIENTHSTLNLLMRFIPTESGRAAHKRAPRHRRRVTVHRRRCLRG